MKKNDIIQLEIIDMGTDGEGIGKSDGFTFFVKDTVIGDSVEAKIMKLKKNYGYARLVKVLVPSPNRIEAKCPVARQCGGCQIQELKYQEQLRFKQRKVENHLKRIGRFDQINMEPIIGMEEPFFYRNKAQFPIGMDKDGQVVTGFYAGRTHCIIPNKKCCLGVEENEIILNKMIDFMNAYKITAYDEETQKGLVRHVLIRYGFTSKQIMVCIVANGRKLPHSQKLVESLCEIEGMTSISLSVNKEHTNVIMGTELVLLWGEPYIRDSIGDISYQISPLSFYQVNPVQTKKMYDKVVEFAGLTGEEVVWDLYCGIGTISLYLANQAKEVYGVEIIPEAIEDAKNNAKLNGIENAAFYVGKAEEVLPEKFAEDGIKADVIVVDPPRKGCDGVLLDTIVEMKPQRIVYVSCDSATLARDLRYLCDRGFEVKRVQAVDNFCQTVHVETVVKLERKVR
jgi:23S rRNA (uracil1939-C5)-methyltransferase